MSLVKERYTLRDNADDIPAPEYDDSREHPTPEQLFIREAAKHLTAKQYNIWEYYTYDLLTKEEIGRKLGMDHTTVRDYIRRIEAKIAKWCAENQEVYNVIKESLR
jgi:DNA-binding CsgD family transcriptional regulator